MKAGSLSRVKRVSFGVRGVFFRCRLDLPLLYPMRGLARLVAG